MPRRAPDPAETMDSLAAVSGWVDRWVSGTASDADRPARPALAAAVRSTLRTLEHVAPGHSVEVRVPPFGAVQCVDGPRHTRGTPPNVVETDAPTWLALATGALDWTTALEAGLISASGHRAGEIARWLPVADVRRTGDKG